MSEMSLDPNAEFAPAPEETPVAPVAPAAPAAQPIDAGARAEVAALKNELASLKSDAAIVGKLREVFTDKGIDPRDAYVRQEITRLLPELQDVQKIRQLIPVVLETLGAAHEEKIAEKASNAIDHLKGYMKGAGLNPEDEDAVGYMEEVLTREIKNNPELRHMWGRGQIKAAVGKAFDKASGKLFAPVRANTKRSAVESITGAPKASPRGAAPSPSSASGTRTVDTGDVSREGKKAVHDAAFDRLQELLDR